MKNKKIFCFLFFILFLLPIAFASDDWPMFRHDPQHTGYTDCEMPDELELLWKYKTGDWVFSSPAVVNGKVYFGSYDNYLYCLDTNGNLLWRYKTGDYVRSSPAVVDGKVYFGSVDNYLYCLDTYGNLLWRYKTGDYVASSPAVVDGKVYFGSGDGYLYCFGEKKEIPPSPTTPTPPTTTPAPTTPPPTTPPAPTTIPPTTSAPTTTCPPPQKFNTLLYAGIFAAVLTCALVIYQITKKKPVKKVKKPTEKKPEETPKPPEKQISPELKELLNEKAEWREKLETLKKEKEDLIRRGVISEKTYQDRYEEIMDKLVDLEDKIIQEKMKEGKK